MCPVIDGLDDGKIGIGIVDVADRLCPAFNGRDKILELVGKRAIGKGKLPDRRFGRPHLRLHAMEREALGAIAAAKTVNVYLTVTAVDFEREGVFPLSAAGVKKSDFLLRRLQ